jgi:CO/xanthine dehydrogenase FAD-binding subunit
MKPAPFEYCRAASVDEACALLAEHGSEAKLIAGGQSLVPMMAMRLLRPAVLVDINDIDALRFIAVEPDRVRIGAGTRQAALEADSALAAALPLIREALRWVGHEQTRNRGTIGGSVVHADPSAELPLAAVMLDATLCLRAQGAPIRLQQARAFFSGPMSTEIAPEECLAELHLPRWSGLDVGCAFDEVSIRHGDFALVSVCAQVGVDGEGRCGRAALALGGAAPIPLDLSAPVAKLVGTRLEDAAVDQVVDEALRDLEPPSDLHASAAYRRSLARVLARRALRQARDDARTRRDDARTRRGDGRIQPGDARA